MLVSGCGWVAVPRGTDGDNQGEPGRDSPDIYVADGKVYAPAASIVHEGTIQSGDDGAEVDGLIGVLSDDGGVFLAHTSLGAMPLSEDTSALAVGAFMAERPDDGAKGVESLGDRKLALGESRILATGVIVQGRGTELYRFTNDTYRWVAIKPGRTARAVFLAPKDSHIDETFIKAGLRWLFSEETLRFSDSVDLEVGADRIGTYGSTVRGVPVFLTAIPSPFVGRELREKADEALAHDAELFKRLNALDYKWMQIEGIRKTVGLLQPECGEALFTDAVLGSFEAWGVGLLTGDQNAQEQFSEEMGLDTVQNLLGCLCIGLTAGVCEVVTTYLDLVALLKWRLEGILGALDTLTHRAFDDIEGVSDPRDLDGDGVLDDEDLCSSDPNKWAPGVCGCGRSDRDSDGDGAEDCIDQCPDDPLRTTPGSLGCGDPPPDDGGLIDNDVDFDILTVEWTGCASSVEFDPPGELLESSDGLRKSRVEDGTRVQISFTACPGWQAPRDESVRVDHDTWIRVDFIPPRDSCEGIACDDGDECTTGTCVDEACVYTTITCNDGDLCTTDSCHPASGCTYTPMHCDDSNACTNDSCAGGECVSTANYDSTNQCCDPTTGTTAVIADGNDCTVDVCDVTTGQVTHAPSPSGNQCDDGDPCTASDQCDGFGVCIEGDGPAPPVVASVSFEDRSVDVSFGFEVAIQDAPTCSSSAPSPDGEFLCLGRWTDLTLRFEIEGPMKPAFLDFLAATRGSDIEIDINGTYFILPKDGLTIWWTHTLDVCIVLQHGSNEIVVRKLGNSTNPWIERIDLRR